MKMIKCIVLSATVLLFHCQILFSSPVSETSARRVAINTCIERCDQFPANLKIDEHLLLQENSVTLCYIYNFSEPNPGFVIISAVDAVTPVLAYSFIDAYSPENQPPQFEYILASFKKQIKYAIKNQVQPSEIVSDEWARLDRKSTDFTRSAEHQQMGPLIQSTWNQYFPYNELCPGGALVGCVAVCMGQIMKYWSYPLQGESSHSYYLYNYGTLSADFGAATYAYDSMPHSSSVSNLPMAKLLYHCGVSVEMNYSTSSSGAYLEGYTGAMSAMQRYFKFDPDMYYDKRYKYPDSAWHEKIFHEIDNYRPMIYTGSDWMTWASHAWNLDGYELVGDLVHFHMNWGWGGSYNGYYYLDDLTPGYSDYTMGQEAVFNIFPYAANSITCYPQNTDYCTGTTNASEKIKNSLVFGSDPEDGWMSFDISSIPDGAEIYSVVFNGYVYERYKPDWAITHVGIDPLTATPADLHDDIVAEQDVGYYYSRNEQNINLPLDWRRYMLSGSVSEDLQDALLADKFTIGIANKQPNAFRYIRYQGWNEDNPPFLKVTFAAYGELEGHVTEYGSGSPLENMYVNIGRLTDTTDANGYYHFDKVPIGNYDVLVEANGNANTNGNPYFNQTINNVAVADGDLTNANVVMEWAEIALDPTSVNVSVNPGEIYNENFTILNNGPGPLDYHCYISQNIGDPLMDFDIELVLDDNAPWGCAFDGTHLWITGGKVQNQDHFIYKLDHFGNLVETYDQGTTSSMGMKNMTFDGTYLYSVDDFGFYRINPVDGNVELMFPEADFPEDIPQMYGLVWVPDIGFITNYQDEGFVVFDETGVQIGVLPNSEIYAYDMGYDHINNCLWISQAPKYTFVQYSLETFSLTGLSIQVPDLEGMDFQWAKSAGFATDLVEGKTTLFGLVGGNPRDRFFAIELENWLQLEGNAYGVVPGEGKGSLDIELRIEPGQMAEATKTIDVVIVNTSGANDTLPVTIENNYIHGSISGYVTEYGGVTPVPNTTIELNGMSDVTDNLGFYQFENLAIGYYSLSVSSPDFIDSIYREVPVPGPPAEFNIQLLWTEIDVNPSSVSINLNPDSELETSFQILNTGPGDLVYNCDLVFPEKSKSPSILVVDKDLSCEELWGGEYRADEWYSFQMALDESGCSYTYYEVLASWVDGPDLETMQQYDLIFWFTGEVDGWSCLTINDENNLSDYLDDGGYLFFSSQDYLSQFAEEEEEFYLWPGLFAFDYLGVEGGQCDQWNVFLWNSLEIQGVTGSIMEGLVFDVGSMYVFANHRIDNLWDHNGIEMFYVDPDGGWDGPCALQYETENFKTVFSTASIANVDDLQMRAEILSRIIERSDMQWLEITENQSGKVGGTAKGSLDVGLKFISDGLGVGIYNAEILIHNNGPDSPYSVPVVLNVTDAATVDLKVFLEGSFVETGMDPVMCQKGLVPLEQPFNKAPWNYTGDESVESIPNNVVIDWILVDFRDATDAASANEASIIKQQAAFLLSDGSIVDLDGASKLLFEETISNNLFFAIRHTNHIGVLSSIAVNFVDGTYLYDFSTSATNVFGGEAGYKQLTGGICGMVAGDANADGEIDDDDFLIWRISAGKAGFYPGDFTLDGEVDNIDKNAFWYPNRDKECQVPE